MRWLSILLALFASSCAIPTTQVIFVVSARGAALRGATELVIRIHGPDGPIEDLPRVPIRAPFVDDAVLARVPVVPIDGDAERLLDFDAQLLDARGAVLAEVTQYNVAFVRDQVREVPVLVVSECEGQRDGSACALECHECRAELCVPSDDGTPCGCPGDTCATGVCNPRVTVRDVQAGSVFVGDSSFSDHTCALAYGGTVSCWGSSMRGALGASGGEGGVPTVVVSSPSITGLAGSAASHCTLSNTAPTCWGDNQSHVVAPSGGNVLPPTPRTVPPATVIAMSGSTAMFALDDEQHLWGWGRNGQAELGIVTSGEDDVTVPTRAAPPRDDWRFLAIDGRSIHACAIRATDVSEQGELWCWGWNESHEVSAGDARFVREPVCVDAPGEPPCPSDWIAVSVGNFHTCGIRADQSLWCWGGTSSGQLGIGPEALGVPNLAGPRRLPGRWRAVSAGQRTTCGIDLEGQLRCWGAAQVRTRDEGPIVSGLLGDGRLSLTSSVPLAVLPPTRATTWRSVHVGARHACAVRESDQTLWCWGDNREHAIDASSDLAVGSPRRVCPASGSAM
ncbi:MAG: hypothetical protein J0L92_11915 [Deltaproteobacteria bacterium]|nr:hypothetical protein [Deltaproteobacteria bacterium]